MSDVSQYVTTTTFIGVNLSKLEERPNVGSMLVRLDFQDDVVPRLLFLKDLGVQDVHLGPMLTKNPYLLTENLENLQNRSELISWSLIHVLYCPQFIYIIYDLYNFYYCYDTLVSIA